MITQGKWEIKDIGYPKDREYWIANNGNVIARVTRVLTDETEAIDNARLIAAAPELLAACKLAAPHISTCIDAFSGAGEVYEILTDIIAKAEQE